MTNHAGPMVIVGAGLTAAKAAEKLRSEGFAGPIEIIGTELHMPYDRPPLSKGLLTGDDDRDSVFVQEPSWYDNNDVALRPGATVVSLDAESRRLRLETGEAVEFGKLLIATGSRPRPIPAPGADLAGVHYLRTLEDSEVLHAALAGGGKNVVLIGAGWIGLEVASAARAFGNAVVIVEPQPVPLRMAVGDELGGVFADLHREHGVDLRLGTWVEEITGEGGAVTGVLTGDGASIAADLVVVGIGAVPNDEFAGVAGLAVEDGIVVDEALRTSHSDIWAAGDVARTYIPRLKRHIRVEHWDNAITSGEAAACSMLGRGVSFDHVPFFYSDQYDLGMEFNGFLDPDRHYEVVYAGDTSSREFIAFWLDGNRLAAGMNVNVWDVSDNIRDLIESGESVDAERLPVLGANWTRP